MILLFLFLSNIIVLFSLLLQIMSHQSQKLKRTLAKKQLLAKLPNLQTLIMEYEQQNDGKRQIIRDITTRSTKVNGNETETKNKKITISYNRMTEAMVTEIQVVESSSKEDEDFEIIIEGLGEKEIQKNIINKMEALIKIVRKEYKDNNSSIPKYITAQIILEKPKMYARLFYAIFIKCRGFPIYSCSLQKLSDFINESSPLTILTDLMLKQYRQLLKQIVNADEALNGLFNVLRSQEFPTDKFNNKRKVIFLQMLAEAILFKKKKNKKKNKKKQQGSKDNIQSQEEQNNIKQQSDNNLLDVIESLGSLPKLQLSLSQQFLENIESKKCDQING